MKKRCKCLGVLLIASLCSIGSVRVSMAEETVKDYSYLEEMSTEQLKELDDIIHEMLEEVSSGTYAEDKAKIMESMYELEENSATLGNTHSAIWEITGADLYTYINKILASTSKQGFLDAIENNSERKKWEAYTDALFGTKLREAQKQNMTALNEQYDIAVERCTEFTTKYVELVADITVQNESLANAIKTFKDTYKEENTEGVDLIVEYYLTCSEYAEYMLSPSGTLEELDAALAEYPEILKQIQKKIDLS